MKTRIVLYICLFFLLCVGLVYITQRKQTPTGLSRGIRTHTVEEIYEEDHNLELLEREIVDLEEAGAQTVVGFIEKVCSESGIIDAQEWEHAMLAEPIVLHDICGLPIIYKFPVIKDENEVIGYINVAANKCLGTNIISFEKPTIAMNPDEIMDNIITKVHEENREIEIRDIRFVVYNGFTNIGVAVTTFNPATDKETTKVYDKDDHEPISDETLISTLKEIIKYDLGSIEERLEKWEGDDQYAYLIIDKLINYGFDIRNAFFRPLDQHEWQTVKEKASLATKSTWKTIDISRCKLYKQLTNDFCARAVLQMFNHYYLGKPMYNQYQIDKQLNIWGWTDKTWPNTLGKYLTNITKLKTWAYGLIDPLKKGSCDSTFFWTAFNYEISNNRPFALVTGSTKDTAHIVFVVGMMEKDKDLGYVVFKEKYLGVYDSGTNSIYEAKVWNDYVISYGQTGYITAE